MLSTIGADGKHYFIVGLKMLFFQRYCGIIVIDDIQQMWVYYSSFNGQQIRNRYFQYRIRTLL